MRRRSILLAVTAVLVLVLAAAVPVGAEPPGDDGKGDGETATGDQAADLLGQVHLNSFTASPRTVPVGESLTLAWNITAPGGVAIRLGGTQVGKVDTRVVTPAQRDELHTLTAHALGATSTVGSITVGFDPCAVDVTGAENAPMTGACSRAGVATIDYEVRERFYQSVLNPEQPNSHEGVVLDPPSWPLRLNACRTEPGSHGRVERYDWTLTPLDTDGAPVTKQTDACQTDVGVPELGRYRADLIARTGPGTQLTASSTIDLHDVLVVSLGDSMASGEGNPDDPGNYVQFPPGFTNPASWADGPCHRSRESGHYKAARRLADIDPKTSVGFVSLACTTAHARHLTSNHHKNLAEQTRPPQLEALHDLLCRYDCNRRIDLLVLSIGVNDVGFAGMLFSCGLEGAAGGAFPLSTLDDLLVETIYDGCDEAVDATQDRVDDALMKLAAIETKIADLGLDVGRVLFTEYPVNLFADANGNPSGGCGVFGEISHDNAVQLMDVGHRLNEHLRLVATNMDGGGYVGGIEQAFRGHGYCADNSWFRSFSGSWDRQGDVWGTAHPTEAGHDEIGRLIARAYGNPSDQPADPTFPEEDAELPSNTADDAPPSAPPPDLPPTRRPPDGHAPVHEP